MSISSRQQRCEEYHIPYFPTQEEFDEADTRGDYQHDLEKQLELDEYMEDR